MDISMESSEERNQIDDANLYSQMYHQPYSGSPGFSNQSFGMHGSSRLSYGADRSDMFDPGQGSSQIEGEGTDPSDIAKLLSDRMHTVQCHSSWGIPHGRKYAKPQKNFCCHFCGKRFVTNRDLDGHKNAWHLNAKPFACSKCGKRFSHKTSYNYHIRFCFKKDFK